MTGLAVPTVIAPAAARLMRTAVMVAKLLTLRIVPALTPCRVSPIGVPPLPVPSMVKVLPRSSAVVVITTLRGLSKTAMGPTAAAPLRSSGPAAAGVWERQIALAEAAAKGPIVKVTGRMASSLPDQLTLWPDGGV